MLIPMYISIYLDELFHELTLAVTEMMGFVRDDPTSNHTIYRL